MFVVLPMNKSQGSEGTKVRVDDADVSRLGSSVGMEREPLCVEGVGSDCMVRKAKVADNGNGDGSAKGVVVFDGIVGCRVEKKGKRIVGGESFCDGGLTGGKGLELVRVGDWAKRVLGFSVQEGSLKSSKSGPAQFLLDEEGCGSNSIWELGQPSCIVEWTVGSDWVSLWVILKEGRAFRRRLFAEFWGAEEIMFGGVGLAEAKEGCRAPDSGPSADVCLLEEASKYSSLVLTSCWVFGG